MKRTYLRVTAALLLAVALFFTSCSKKGDQGPAGTANVLYSDWLDVIYKPDTVHNGSVIDTIGYYATITATKLDINLLNKGELKVYLNTNTAADPVVYPLPYYDVYTDISISALFHLQKIELYADIDASTFTTSGAKRFQYRYILIPGGASANASINLNNYQETKTALGLKD